ncbi:MAG: amidase [Alphaproteobacteria bacterium]|nr:amidase [Alphaproteobacteria bacterium]
MHFADYAKYDGLGLAQLVKKKKVKPLELVDAAIARIEAENPRLNAVIWTMFDRARTTAKKKLPEGPFQGVPFLVKDIAGGMKGVPTRAGSRMVPTTPADHDATLTERYLKAGLIPLGKTNVPEFGLVGTTESKLYGPARNPWNTKFSTGGSSGGSGAAVAAGMVPVAHANDGGGSIRIPAACNGLVGLKPTRARNPLGPDLGDMMSGLVADHVVSRTVRDTAAMLDATAGPALGDPYWAPPQPRSYLAESKKAPRPLKIGMATKRMDGRPVHDDCVTAVKKAAKICRALGHKVTEASPPVGMVELTGPFMALWTSAVTMQVDMLSEMTGEPPTVQNLEGLTLGLYEAGKKVTAAQYQGAIAIIQAVSRAIAAWHETYDLWLTPTLASPPLALGDFSVDVRDVEKGFGPMLDYVPFTPIQNATGQPAINIPLHWNDDNLPIGVQFVARFGDEATLLQLAGQLEREAPWAAHYDTLWA